MIDASFVVEVLRRRIRRVPAWVTVILTAAMVGAISAVVSVSALARYQRNQPALEVQSQETVD